MTEMFEKDSLRSFLDALQKSESAARELAAMCKDAAWLTVAETLREMRINGKKLAEMKPMTKTEIEQALALKTDVFRKNAK